MKAIAKSFFYILVRLYIWLKKPEIIAIAGSVGKSSTTHYIHSILRKKLKLEPHTAGYNEGVGLVLSLFNLEVPKSNKLVGWISNVITIIQKIIRDPKHLRFAQEVGVDRPEEMSFYADLLKPRTVIITNISEEHMEYFISVENVAKEELRLAQDAEFILINKTEVSKKFINRYLPGKTIKYYEPLDNLNNICPNIIGLGSASSIGAVLELAKIYNIEPRELEKELELVKSFKGRMAILHGVNNSIIIDDTYNASPSSVVNSVKTLLSLEGKRKIAALGGINELGNHISSGYKKASEDINKLDLIILFTPEAIEQYSNYISDKKVVIKVKNAIEAGEFLKKELKEGDVVLVKGSQGDVYGEEAVKVILYSQEDVVELVRQDRKWLKIKSLFFNTQL